MRQLCGCGGDIPTNPIPCELCNVEKLCLRCSVDDYPFCASCRKEQETLIGKYDVADEEMPICQICQTVNPQREKTAIVHQKCSWNRCKTMAARCREHINKCARIGVIVEDIRDLTGKSHPCTPPPRCRLHEDKCNCQFQCAHCLSPSSLLCGICKSKICTACSVITSDVTMQSIASRRVCRMHATTCGICRQKTFNVMQTTCAHYDISYDAEGLPVFNQCGAITCASNHKLKYPTTDESYIGKFVSQAIAYFNPVHALRYSIHSSSADFCSSHTTRCGILQCVPDVVRVKEGKFIGYDAIKTSSGCGQLTAKAHSREVHFKTIKNKFDFCIDCFAQLRQVFIQLLKLRKGSYPWMDKFIIEKIILNAHPITYLTGNSDVVVMKK